METDSNSSKNAQPPGESLITQNKLTTLAEDVIDDFLVLDPGAAPACTSPTKFSKKSRIVLDCWSDTESTCSGSGRRIRQSIHNDETEDDDSDQEAGDSQPVAEVQIVAVTVSHANNQIQGSQGNDAEFHDKVQPREMEPTTISSIPNPSSSNSQDKLVDSSKPVSESESIPIVFPQYYINFEGNLVVKPRHENSNQNLAQTKSGDPDSPGHSILLLSESKDEVMVSVRSSPVPVSEDPVPAPEIPLPSPMPMPVNIPLLCEVDTVTSLGASESPIKKSNNLELEGEQHHVRNLFNTPMPSKIFSSSSNCNSHTGSNSPIAPEVVVIEEATTTNTSNLNDLSPVTSSRRSLSQTQSDSAFSMSSESAGSSEPKVAIPVIEQAEPEIVTVNLRSPNFILDLINENKPKADTILRLKDGILGAHKLVLASCSPFLGKLLMEQSDVTYPTIVLPDVDKKTMQKVLHLMYFGFLLYSPDDNVKRAQIQDAMNIIRIVSPQGYTVQPVEPEAIVKFREHCRRQSNGAATTSSTTTEARNPTPEPLPEPVPGTSRQIHSSPSSLGLVQRVVGRTVIKSPPVTVHRKRKRRSFNPRPRPAKIIHTIVSSEFYKITKKESSRTGIQTAQCQICQEVLSSNDTGFLLSIINGHFDMVHKNMNAALLANDEISELQKCDSCNESFPTVKEAEACLKSHETARCWKCLETFPIDLIRDHYLASHVDPQSAHESVNTYVRCNWCPKLVNIRLTSDVVGLHCQSHLPEDQIPSSETEQEGDDEDSESEASISSTSTDSHSDYSVISESSPSMKNFINSDSHLSSSSQTDDIEFNPKKQIRLAHVFEKSRKRAKKRMGHRRKRKTRFRLRDSNTDFPSVQPKRVKTESPTHETEHSRPDSGPGKRSLRDRLAKRDKK